jgi:4-amino-4-deoxy-L-arabinose transferase-like glycosyltransferase
VEPLRAAKHSTYALLAIAAFAIVIFFFWLGRLALIGPDEPRYAEVAREMFATGDWISPRLCGCLWFEKPVLLYWMAAACYRLFGVAEFAARFPSAAAATAAALFLYIALSRSVAPRLALVASFVLMTSGIFIAYARVSTPDMPFAASMTIALLSGYQAARSSGRAKLGYWALCFAGLALALLAKGLAGAVLPVAIFAIYFAIIKQLKFIRWRDALAGVAIFLAVAGAWYVPVTMRHGWEFIEEFIIRQHLRRYTSNTFGHPQPFYFFFAIAAVGVAPWMFFLAPAVRRLSSLKPRAVALDSLLAFAWIWVATPVLFFSLSESKLPGYILPVFPALAIIIGAEVERFIAGDKTPLLNAAAWVTAVLLAVISAGFAIYLLREQVSASGFRWVLFALPLLIAVATIASLATKKRQAFAISAAAVVLSLVISAAILLLPKLSDELTLKTLSLEVAAALKPGERIAFFIKKEFAPVFYSEGRVVCGVGDNDILNALSQDVLESALENEPSLIVITTSNWRKGLENDQRFFTELIATQGNALAFRVSLNSER